MRKKHLIPLAVCLWLCCGLVTWAQVTVQNGNVFDTAFLSGVTTFTLSGGTTTWTFNSIGNLVPTSNGARDLGSVNSQVRDIFVARSVQGGAVKTLTESVATGFVTVAIANSTAVAGKVVYTIRASDATDTQGVSGELFFSCVSTSAGAVTCGTISDQHTQNPVSTGTLTNTMTNTTGANLLTLLANAASSLTQTTLRIDYRVELQGNTTTVTGL